MITDNPLSKQRVNRWDVMKELITSSKCVANQTFLEIN